MAQTLKCSTCKKDLPTSAFYPNRKTSASRKFHYNCKKCYKLLRTSRKTKIRSTGTSLQDLLEIRRHSFWPISDVRKAMGLYITAKRNNEGIDQIKQRYNQYGFKQAFGTFTMLIVELRKAAKAGMTLEQYFEAGRPYSTQAKNQEVIAKR